MVDVTTRNLRREADAARGLIAALGEMDDATRHDTIEGETGLHEAIDAALAEIDECGAIEAGCGHVVETYQKRAANAKNRAQRIRGLIEQAMLIAEVSTIKRPTGTLTVKAIPPKAKPVDDALIPVRFWIPQPPKLDLKAISDAFKAGETIPGVSTDNGGTSLQIRRL